MAAKICPEASSIPSLKWKMRWLPTRRQWLRVNAL
jgi:hypothetical protein